MYKRLVSTKVLDVGWSTSKGRSTRVYAHCAKSGGPYFIPPGSVVLLAVNVGPEDSTLELTGELQGKASPRLEFFMTPADASSGVSSKTVGLNEGAALETYATGSPVVPYKLPDLPAKSVPAGGADIVVPSLRYGYIVLTGARAAACF